MSFDEKFSPVRNAFYQMVGNLFTQIARLFGYPNNPGIPTSFDLSSRERFLESLPIHKTSWPPLQRPETWFEMIFGPTPKLERVPRYIYESKEEGFYNFYIENYKNIYFLPDWLSEFIQVRLHICLDITPLENFREVLFVGMMVFSQLILLRIAASWFLLINPYAVPWCYVMATVDWTEEILQGAIPSILGINVTGTAFLGLLGIMADSLNHLVLTMPFLPSEGEETKVLINQKMKDVLVFHYLPVLWYRYPIPNEIREFWYQERPDIGKYMQNAYPKVQIKFFPEQHSINDLRIWLNSSSDSISSLSTEVLSKENGIPTEGVFTHFNLWNEQFQTFLMNSFERFF